jgi:hypothetical protein
MHGATVKIGEKGIAYAYENNVFMPVQLKPTKCTLVIFHFTKVLRLVSGHEGASTGSQL